MESKIYKINSPEDEKLTEVGKILSEGGIVAIPTETVYGLAGSALKGETANKIFSAKGRPTDNPLIVHINEISQWAPLVKEIPEDALRLAQKFWPGPLTIILPKSDLIPKEVSGGLNTVGVRMPENKIARKIIEKSGVPLAAPSANTSGKPSPTSAKHVIDDLYGKIDGIVDSGECSVGVESTVISLCESPARLFRPGGVTAEELTEVLGEIVIDDAVYEKLGKNEKVSSPGLKYKHYSPKAEVIIVKGSFSRYKDFCEKNKADGVFCLCYEEEKDKLSLPSISFGKKDDLSSQARQIFDSLRKIDEIGAKKVYARFPEKNGLGLAVFNRLIRAAAFNIIEV